MIIQIKLFFFMFFTIFALHHHHYQATSNWTNIENKLINLKESNQRTISNLNSLTQPDRIKTLQKLLSDFRSELLSINKQLSTSTVQSYCKQIPQKQLSTILNSISDIQNKTNAIGSVDPFNKSDSNFKPLQNNIKDTLSNIKNTVEHPSNITNTQNIPQQVNQPNLLAQNWVLGSDGTKALTNQFNLTTGQNGKQCPLANPYSNINNECISCDNTVFDMTSKTCVVCKNYDKKTHKCLDNNQPMQFKTNTDNSSKIILPLGTTLQSYKNSLQNEVPSCPLSTPYFNGSICILCPQNQFFSIKISSCQTCPQGTIHSSTTLHCQTIAYTSQLQGTAWISTSRTPEALAINQSQTLKNPNSMICPKTTPYFNGSSCIQCVQPKPIFSFDSLQCTSCTNGIYSPNLHTCTQLQKGLSNLSSSNLILDGRSLNEWKYYYIQNITADNSVTDCPSAKPYFDGISCVQCSTSAPYFNLQKRLCQNCSSNSAYNPQVRECLSVSGNIVTQGPTLSKMAAGIFA